MPVPRVTLAKVRLPSDEIVKFGLLSSVRLTRLMSPSPPVERIFVEPSAPERLMAVTLPVMSIEPLLAAKSTLAARLTDEAFRTVMDAAAVMFPVSKMVSLVSVPEPRRTWLAVSAPTVRLAPVEPLSPSEVMVRLPLLISMLLVVTVPSAVTSRSTLTPEVIAASEIVPSLLASMVTPLRPLRLMALTLFEASRLPPLAVRFAPAKSTLLKF